MDDGRRKLLSLTERGMDTYAPLNAASNREVEAMLDRLSEPEQRRLLDAMKDIEELLGATPEHRVSWRCEAGSRGARFALQITRRQGGVPPARPARCPRGRSRSRLA